MLSQLKSITLLPCSFIFENTVVKTTFSGLHYIFIKNVSEESNFHQNPQYAIWQVLRLKDFSA
jgi:hypothetical protein